MLQAALLAEQARLEAEHAAQVGWSLYMHHRHHWDDHAITAMG
jgi:hypothetical protein